MKKEYRENLAEIIKDPNNLDIAALKSCLTKIKEDLDMQYAKEESTVSRESIVALIDLMESGDRQGMLNELGNTADSDLHTFRLKLIPFFKTYELKSNRINFNPSDFGIKGV